MDWPSSVWPARSWRPQLQPWLTVIIATMIVVANIAMGATPMVVTAITGGVMVAIGTNAVMATTSGAIGATDTGAVTMEAVSVLCTAGCGTPTMGGMSGALSVITAAVRTADLDLFATDARY